VPLDLVPIIRRYVKSPWRQMTIQRLGDSPNHAHTLSPVNLLTREQVESRKKKAAQFTDNLLGDPGTADAIAHDSVED
jgi:hypothetical protein